jgi:hypothetical protein
LGFYGAWWRRIHAHRNTVGHGDDPLTSLGNEPRLKMIVSPGKI